MSPLPRTLAAGLALAAPAAALLPAAPLTAAPQDGDAADDHPTLPVGFRDEVVSEDFFQAAGLAVAADGRILVYEQGGLVHLVENGVVQATPFLDLREEVAAWGTHGLLGFALDPAFLANGHVYACYAVDYHHLTAFGTPQYDPGASAPFVDTIGRVTRYTARAADGFRTVDPESRLVLVGETITTGLPICSTLHSTGELAFGADGTLLVCVGDGAGAPASGTCLADGIIQPKEDVAAFRAQLVDSHSGKILRIDPATGDGVPSNPFYDPAFPRAPRSRVWALGFRNPFRMTLRPGTGSTDPAAGAPGTLLVTDVGVTAWEELDVIDAGGLNLGWPLYEGLDPYPPKFDDLTQNLDAPNPLFGLRIPPFGTCTQPYFHFQDLLVQDAAAAPSWPNPCDPGQAVRGSAPTLVHRRPALEWAHFADQLEAVGDSGGGARRAAPAAPGSGPVHDEGRIAHAAATRHGSGSDPGNRGGNGGGNGGAADHGGEGLARVPVYDAFGAAAAAILGEPGTPVEGESFLGACGIAGAWYDGVAFPSGYQDTFFLSDYTDGWIRSLVFGGGDELLAVNTFKADGGHVVDLAVDPIDGSLLYVEFTSLGTGRLHRISYDPENQPPTAVAVADAAPWGPAPLPLVFDGTASTDPEGLPLAHAWDFDDGTPPSQAPVALHTFPSEDVTATGTLVARVLELVPPGSMGTGNPDPEVMRDGDYPPAGTDAPERQYDTIHVDGSLVPDKGPLDWVGYEFSQPRTFLSVLFQEGMHAPPLGGWWDAFGVEVRQGDTWTAVSDLVVTPPYPGSLSLDFERFELHFAPVTGDAIRVVGSAGGSLEYVSVGELRVVARSAAPPAGPVNYDVTLTVTDSVGATDTAVQTVSLGNSPPVAQIVSPPDGASYSTSSPQTFVLSGTRGDAEHLPSELACAWQVVLHHDDHNHPGAIDPACDTLATLVTDGCDGSLHYHEIRYTVTDPLGLSSTAVHYLLPDCDLNLNFTPDALDIAAGTSLDDNGDGIPDEAQVDCDGDGRSDLFELFFGQAVDADGDGVPDDCLRTVRRPGAGAEPPPVIAPHGGAAITPTPGG